LTPNVSNGSNASGDTGQALTPLPQINEIQAGSAPQSGATAAAGDGTKADADASQPASDQEISSSKHKKKKGLKKVVPF
jgi:hypothetical protein